MKKREELNLKQKMRDDNKNKILQSLHQLESPKSMTKPPTGKKKKEKRRKREL